MDGRRRGLLPQACALAALYAGTCIAGGLLLVAAFQAGVFGGIAIMFYRGLVVSAGIFVLLLAALALALARRSVGGLQARDAIAAAAISLAANIAFLTVVPVTVDRSISLFLLARLDDRPQASVTPDEMAAIFTRVYVGEDRQIARRLVEQATSGNLERVGDGYRISARGRMVVAAARFVARLFDSRAGLVSPAKPQSASN